MLGVYHIYEGGVKMGSFPFLVQQLQLQLRRALGFEAG